MKNYRYILVGAGGFASYWQRRFLPTVTPFAQCVAVVDIDPDALESAKEFALVPPDRYYTNLRYALEHHECDFLALVVPPEVRLEMIDLAIEFGLDVLCEKPVASSMEDSIAIYKKMNAAGRKISVTMSHRMEREKQTLEALVKSGEYGKLNYIHGRLTIRRRHSPATGRYANMEQLDLLTSMRRGLSEGVIHELDTLRGISGSNAAKVFCKYWQFAPGDGTRSNSAFVLVTMENGVQCMIEHSNANATTMNGWSNEYFRAECANATLVADHQRVTVSSEMGYPYPISSEIPLLSGELFDHGMIMRDFCAWLGGGPEPATSLEDNLQCTALAFAALKSAVTGQEVDVQAFLRESLQMNV